MAAEETTLVFPANHPDGMEYIVAARERGEKVVAASSQWDADAVFDIGEIVELPYVNDPKFLQVFDDLVLRHNISRVYAPAGAVFTWFKRQIEEQRLQIQLIGWSPIAREAQRVRKVLEVASRYESFIAACSDRQSALSKLEIAAAFRMCGHIFGESNSDKIAAMLTIFASTPKGDVVEVGALVGKSVSVLHAMARKYSVGPVLAIDPWQAVASAQLDSPATLRVDVDGVWEQELPMSFMLNLLPLASGQFNYLRMPSQQGFQTYTSHTKVTSTEFGTVSYEGKVSVIHIDGNHDYVHAKADCDAWVPLIKPLGWLVLDDYVWSHGEGPRRVGDALLLNGARAIERAFVCGKALFIQFAE